MTSVFTFPGGAATNIAVALTATTPTVIVDGSVGQTQVAWFRCNEMAGGTPSITVDIYDINNAKAYIQGTGALTYIAQAMTAKQSVLFDEGYVVPTGFQLRVTASVANQVQVVGVKIGKQRGAA